MKKAALLFLALVVLVGFAVKESEAGQLCWKFDGYNDYIKVTVSNPDPLYSPKLLIGMWYSPAAYVLPLVGTMVKDIGGTPTRVSLQATYGAGSSLQNPIALDASLDPVTKNGTLGIYYHNTDSVSSFTITKINCSTAPAP